MQSNPNKAEIDMILVDILKCERNQNPMERKYSIPCTYFGLANCNKLFCVAKKWWDTRPQKSDGTRNHISVHWYNKFKSLYDTKKTPHGVLKMTDNHLRILYYNYILKHGGNHYPYLDYDEQNQRYDHINADASERKERH